LSNRCQRNERGHGAADLRQRPVLKTLIFVHRHSHIRSIC
jgi:hypothetical protein